MRKGADRRADLMRLNTLLAEARLHITRYGLVAAFIIASAEGRLYAEQYYSEYGFFPTIWFYPTVVLAAYFLGFGPAIFGVAIGTTASRYLFMLPYGQFFDLVVRRDFLRLSWTFLFSATFAYLISRLQASKRRLALVASEAIQSRDLLLREQQLLRRLIAQQEAEKQALCNDFHDGLIQHVVGSKMLLESQLEKVPAADPMHEIVHHLGKGIADGRRVIRGVRPSVLDEPGLSGPLHELVEHFSTVGLQVDVAACLDGNDSDIPDAIRTAVFRICQEALTNCWKHSGCNKATVRIEKRGDCLHVEIDDDGHGIDHQRQAVNTGFGLKGMDARARLLGGSLDVVPKDKGTRVRAQLPLRIVNTTDTTTRTASLDLRSFIASLPRICFADLSQGTHYMLAAASVGVSLSARLSIHNYLRGNYLATEFFYPMVIWIAFVLGLGPALFATVLSTAAYRYFFMYPYRHFLPINRPSDWFRLAFFLFMSSWLAYLISRLQASKRRLALVASEAIQSRDLLLREQQLLRRLIAQQEAEKQALCNDFHDGLIQHVVGSKMLLESQLEKVPAADPMHEIVHHLGKGIADGRRVIRGVRPSVLDEPGLSGPLHELVEHFSTVGLQVDVAACLDGNDSDIPDAIRTAVFRICQEALMNCWKHSGCNKATIRIEKQGDCLNVEIDDDGHGIDHHRQAANTGFGLEGMDARARLLGGSLEIVHKDKGTRVRAQLPLCVLQTA